MRSIFTKSLFNAGREISNQIIFGEHGRIVKIKDYENEDYDFQAEYLSAAFFDLQINGGTHTYFTEKVDLESIADISESFRKVGTGFTLPTIVTSPLDHILKAIESIQEYKKKYPNAGVLGMHLEGPFINPIKKGAHAEEWVRKPTTHELEEIIKYGKGVIKLMTIAPEVFTESQLELLLESGITLSVGHSNATYEEAQAAFGKGIKLITHLYNAMSLFVPRKPGLVGAIFDSPEVAAPMILDGLHSAYPSARLAYQVKGEKLFFISDALFLGNEVKDYSWKQFNAHFENNKYLNKEGHLAGSNISLADTVRNASHHLGIALPEIIDMVTQRPAKAVGMEQKIGSVELGFPAVFTAFDASLNSFKTISI